MACLGPLLFLSVQLRSAIVRSDLSIVAELGFYIPPALLSMLARLPDEPEFTCQDGIVDDIFRQDGKKFRPWTVPDGQARMEGSE